jgi:spermidine synthase
VIKPDMLRQTIARASAVFGHYRPYACTLRPFPEGVSSFLMAGDSKEALDGFDGGRYKDIAESCVYYNAEVHTGAFLLPRSIRNVVSG